MATIRDVALDFASGRSSKCHNASTDGMRYTLHRSIIAKWACEDLVIDWCGWYTPTTANHINAILDACLIGQHVSYADAKRQDVSRIVYPNARVTV